MNESTWHPQPGDRVLIRNAGEYGWAGSDEEATFDFGGRLLSHVNDPALNCAQDNPLGHVVTVLRSDLSPVEPRWQAEPFSQADAYGLNDPAFERRVDSLTEETRRLTKEDYADVEATRLSALKDELIEQLLEGLDPKLAESYRARTRKEGR